MAQGLEVTATTIDADERGTRILLDALSALGLLERNNGYRLSPLADTFLVSSRPSYVGGMVNILAPPWVWSSWPSPSARAITELLRAWSEQRESLEILDVACGSGLLGLTLAAQHPTARSTLLGLT